MICIYSIEINGKFYIGQTVNVKNRRKYHLYFLKNNKHYNSHLQRSYNKYNVLEFKIIEECNIEQLNEKELYYINLYDSYYNGYNATVGGDSCVDRITKKSKKIFQYSKLTGELTHNCLGFANMSRYANINESNIRQICYNKMKTCKGFHYSLILKTPNQVLNDIIKINVTDEFRQIQSINSLGNKNPMYGKKRPENMGENNAYSIMIKNGYKVKRKIKLSELEIIDYYKLGKTQKEIGKIAECSQANISDILRQNNIKTFRRQREKPLPCVF